MTIALKPLKSAYETLVLWAGVFAAPTPSAAVKAGFKTAETLRDLSAPEKMRIERMAETLMATAEGVLDDLPDSDTTNGSLQAYRQMIEASAPEASRIVELALEPGDIGADI